MKISCSLFIFLSVILLSLNAYSLEFQIVGSRAVGMGGAHVAVVNDATASYWNPAAYGFFGWDSDGSFEASLLIGAGAVSHNKMLQEVSDINNYNFKELSEKAENGNIATEDIDDLIHLVAEVDDLDKEGLSATLLYDIGLSVRYENFGIGALALGNVSAIPSLDLDNIGVGSTGSAVLAGPFTPSGAFTPEQRSALESRINTLAEWDTAETIAYLDRVDQALEGAPASAAIVEAVYKEAKAINDIDSSSGGKGNLSDNDSKMTLQGIALFEVPLSYGFAFSDNFSVGVNLKFMRAITYFKEVSVFDVDSTDPFNNFSQDSKTDNNIGIDLGVMYRYEIFGLGLVGKNLNSPSFDFAGPGDFEVGRQIRAGFSFNPFSFLILALDIDLTNNRTTVSNGYTSRMLSIGSEIQFSEFFMMRLGTYRNLAESDIGQVYTAGFGMNLIEFKFDIAGALSTDSDKYNESFIPAAEAKISFNLAWEF